MAKRIFLFVLTNIAIVATLTIVVSLLGLNQGYRGGGLDIGALATFCFIYGMPKIACSRPAGKGGVIRFPFTKCVSGTSIASAWPGSAWSGRGIRRLVAIRYLRCIRTALGSSSSLTAAIRG